MLIVATQRGITFLDRARDAVIGEYKYPTRPDPTVPEHIAVGADGTVWLLTYAPVNGTARLVVETIDKY